MDRNADLETIWAALNRRARRLSSNPADAEDLAQDAMLRLLRHLGEGRAVENREAYAMTILRNLARAQWRRAEIWAELEDHHGTVLPDAEAALACADLRRAIARLPAPQAALMEMVAGGETSPQVIARTTGLSVGTVMSRLARARARLRAEMEGA